MTLALHAAMRLQAVREHSQQQLRHKLLRHSSVGVVEAVLRQLQEAGYQSDARFAQAYVRMRIDKGYGPLRIRAELQERGIASELIQYALEMDDGQWRQRLQRAAQKKFGPEPGKDRNALAKQGRFLSSRGFPSHLINDYLFTS